MTGLEKALIRLSLAFGREAGALLCLEFGKNGHTESKSAGDAHKKTIVRVLYARLCLCVSFDLSFIAKNSEDTRGKSPFRPLADDGGKGSRSSFRIVCLCACRCGVGMG